MEFEQLIVSIWADDDATQRNQTLGWRYRCQNFFVSLYMRTASAVQLLIVIPFVLVRKLCRLYRHDSLEFFDALPHEGVVAASKYIARKSVDDIIKFKDICTRVESLENLLQLLPRTSEQQMHTVGNNYPDFLRRNDMKVCSLSLALLVKVAQVSMPKDQLESLLKASKEAYEIVHFIDKTLQTKSSEDNNKLSYAKAVWIGGDFSCLLSDDVTGIKPDLERAVAVIEKLKNKLESDKVCSELQLMVNFIKTKQHSSIKGLCDFMKQMFGDMLRALFSQLPIAIYKSLSECSAEEFEESVQLAMKFLFLTQLTGPREDEIDWLFPPATDISSFITGDTSAPSTGSLERLSTLCLTDRELEIIHGVNGV
ncbi:hypothetical protein FRX31_007776 [Thalictrum thalictroides]|uniref:Uncharacterized protein n=1 Tax=Thalictrum thalictroides TaxID=46969 RepID=A0A7J6X0R4_THATH|nr:hypothetical protein FRX31_007776 [Thalictrum thalictroides]